METVLWHQDESRFCKTESVSRPPALILQEVPPYLGVRKRNSGEVMTRVCVCQQSAGPFTTAICSRLEEGLSSLVSRLLIQNQLSLKECFHTDSWAAEIRASIYRLDQLLKLV